VSFLILYIQYNTLDTWAAIFMNGFESDKDGYDKSTPHLDY